MTDQNKNQAQKAQPSDLISSMKNKNDLKEAEKNNTNEDDWDEYDDEHEETPTQTQTTVKEKENKEKGQPQKLGDILKNNKPIQQNQKKNYNQRPAGDRRPKEGGPRKYYNNNANNAEGKQQYTNNNPNYARRNKDDEKNELLKKMGNFAKVVDGDAKNVNTVKPTKTYDVEASSQRREEGFEKPVFKNATIEGESGNFRKFDEEEDLYIKNLKKRGLDKEPEREEGAEEGENKGKERRPYQNKNRTYNNNNFRGPRKFNTGEKKQEKDLDEDGFERVGGKPKRPQYSNRGHYDGRKHNDEENKVWEDFTNKNQQEEGDNQEENKEGDSHAQQEHREERPRKEYKDKRDRKPKREQQKNWEPQEEVEQKQVVEEVVQQPKKVEFTMKAVPGGLKGLFAKKN